MKLPGFEYASPTTVQEAVALLAASKGTAKPLAGGGAWCPFWLFAWPRRACWSISAALQVSNTIAIDDAGVHLGARVRWCDIEADARLATAHPLLAAAVTRGAL
jgi:carbon-monoxide dehydrogenase medium subunit